MSSQQDSWFILFFGWVKQPSSHILSPRLKLPRQHRAPCLCQMQKHPLPLCIGCVMVPQCSFYQPRLCLAERVHGLWQEMERKHQAAGLWNRREWFISPTSFTCCDSFRLQAAGTSTRVCLLKQVHLNMSFIWCIIASGVRPRQSYDGLHEWWTGILCQISFLARKHSTGAW